MKIVDSFITLLRKRLHRSFFVQMIVFLLDYKLWIVVSSSRNLFRCDDETGRFGS